MDNYSLSDFSFKRTLFIKLFIVAGFTISAAQSLENIEGKWEDPLSGGIILVYEEGGLYIGQLIGANDPELDKKIKEEEKVFLLENFERKNSTEYCCGTLFLPRRNKKLNAALILKDQNTLSIKWKFGFLRGNHSWKRI